MKEFFKGVFSDVDGKGSFTRLGSGLWLVAFLVWDSYRVFSGKGLPEAASLAAQSGVVATLYTLNATKNVLKRSPPVGANEKA